MLSSGTSLLLRSHFNDFFLLHPFQVFRRGLFGKEQGPAFPRFQASHVQQVPNITTLSTFLKLG